MIALPQIDNCNDCGVCCTEQAALPTSWYFGAFRFGDPGSLPIGLRLDAEKMLADFRAGHFPPDGSPYVWYDVETKRCRHYEHRPEICRDFKPGSAGCLEWRRGLESQK